MAHESREPWKTIMDLISNWAEGLASMVGLRPWAISVFLIVLLALLLDFVQRRVMKKLSEFVKQTSILWDDALFAAAGRPLTILIWLLGITIAAQLIPADTEDHLFSGRLIVTVRQLGVLTTLTWFLVSFIKNIEISTIESAIKM